jgi:signal transduction histidine kinase
MIKDENYLVLQKEFAETFTKDLIPGILHNFANPLNSIMGRSKLLQRRFEEVTAKITQAHPEVADESGEDFQRIKTEITTINNESEIFFDLFRSLSAKFYMLDSKGESRINLSQLLTDEIRFFFFYLDFKHELKTTMKLNYDVPSFKGNVAELSLAFWKLIRFAVSRSLASILKELYIETTHDNKNVIVLIRDSGAVLPAADIENLLKQLRPNPEGGQGSVIDPGILPSLLIMNKYQAKINILSEENCSTISLKFPYQSIKLSSK